MPKRLYRGNLFVFGSALGRRSGEMNPGALLVQWTNSQPYRSAGGGRRGGPGRAGQGVGDPIQRAVVVRRRDEPRLEGRGWQVHTGVEHPVEEGRVGRVRL